MIPLQIELLKEITTHGLVNPFNISPFMVKHFVRPPYLGGDNIGRDRETEMLPRYFLLEMLNSEYIDFESSTLYAQINYFDISGFTPVDKWFDNTDFYIRFKLKGLEYLNQYNLTQSNLLAYKTAKINQKIQIIVSILALCVAIYGTMLAHYKNEKPSNVEIEKRLKTLELRIKNIVPQTKQPKNKK